MVSIATMEDVPDMTQIIASAYSPSITYAIGDHVFYNGILYKCTIAITTAEVWTAAHWTAVKVGPEFTNLKTQMDTLVPINLADGVTTVPSTYIDYQTGNEANSNNAFCTDLIDIAGITTILYSRYYTISTTNKWATAFYDANGDFIPDSVIRSSLGNETAYYELYAASVPNGAKYVRISGANALGPVSLYDKADYDNKVSTGFGVVKNEVDNIYAAIYDKRKLIWHQGGRSSTTEGGILDNPLAITCDYILIDNNDKQITCDNGYSFSVYGKADGVYLGWFRLSNQRWYTTSLSNNGKYTSPLNISDIISAGADEITIVGRNVQDGSIVPTEGVHFNVYSYGAQIKENANDIKKIENRLTTDEGEIEDIQTSITLIDNKKLPFPLHPNNTVDFGTYGKIAASNGIGGTQWVDPVSPNQDEIEQALENWIDAHPGSTATVNDNSLTAKKLATGCLGFVTPEMYGAIGDGAADDTDALQDAVDYAAQYGFYVLATHHYLISERITVKNGTHILGFGRGKIIKDPTADYSLDENQYPAIGNDKDSEVDNIVLEGLTIISSGYWINQSGHNQDRGIQLYGTNIVIEGNRIENCGRCGIAVTGSNILIHKNTVITNIDFSIATIPNYNFGINYNAENITVSENVISGVIQGIMVGLTNRNASIVNNNISTGSVKNGVRYGQHGIYISFAYKVLISGNVVHDCGLAGIKIQSNNIFDSPIPEYGHVTISNNIISNCGAQGILVTRVSGDNKPDIKDILIESNNIYNVLRGINIVRNSNVIISDNIIKLASQYGILLSASYSMTISGNRIEVDGASSGIYFKDFNEEVIVDPDEDDDTPASETVYVYGDSMVTENRIKTDTGNAIRLRNGRNIVFRSNYLVGNNIGINIDNEPDLNVNPSQTELTANVYISDNYLRGFANPVFFSNIDGIVEKINYIINNAVFGINIRQDYIYISNLSLGDDIKNIVESAFEYVNIVFLPAGEYSLSEKLAIPDGKTLILCGDYHNTTIAPTVIRITSDNGGFILGNNAHFVGGKILTNGYNAKCITINCYNKPIDRTSISDTMIIGDREASPHIYTQVGVYIECDYPDGEAFTRYGHLMQCDFDLYIDTIGIAYHFHRQTSPGTASGGVWMTESNIHGYIRHCTRYIWYDLATNDYANNDSIIDATLQAGSLYTGETNYPGINIMGNGITLSGKFWDFSTPHNHPAVYFEQGAHRNIVTRVCTVKSYQQENGLFTDNVTLDQISRLAGYKQVPVSLYSDENFDAAEHISDLTNYSYRIGDIIYIYCIFKVTSALSSEDKILSISDDAFVAQYPEQLVKQGDNTSVGNVLIGSTNPHIVTVKSSISSSSSWIMLRSVCVSNRITTY